MGKARGGLEEAAADVKRLGADRVVRVYIGPTWDPSGKDDNSPLDVKVQRADYRAFLAGFPVVMLTAYDTAWLDRYKRGHLDAYHLAATKDEFRRFTLQLAKTLALPGEILTAFEFTIVPGFTGRPSGLVEVGAVLKGVDLFSYSAWWSIGWDMDAPTVHKSFDWPTHLIRDFALANRQTTRLIIGEFGEYWNMHPRGERLKALVDASLDDGVEYLFNWVLYDQPGNKDEWGRDASHFGKYGLDRLLTPQGKAFQGWFPARDPQPQRRCVHAAPPEDRPLQCLHSASNCDAMCTVFVLQ